MPNATLNSSVTIGGLLISSAANRTADHPNPYEITLPVGLTVTSWSKTDANTAGCNLPGGHGYANGNFDCRWVEASVPKARYGVPGTISTNALSLDGGTGDDFPATSTTGIIVTRQVRIETAINGDEVEIAAIKAEYVNPSSTAKARVQFNDVADAAVAEFLLTANKGRYFDIGGGDDNPFTGNPITYSVASNGSTTEVCTLKIATLEDSTP